MTDKVKQKCWQQIQAIVILVLVILLVTVNKVGVHKSQDFLVSALYGFLNHLSKAILITPMVIAPLRDNAVQ